MQAFCLESRLDNNHDPHHNFKAVQVGGGGGVITPSPLEVKILHSVFNLSEIQSVNAHSFFFLHLVTAGAFLFNLGGTSLTNFIS